MIIGGVEGVCSEKPNNANTNNPQPHHSQTQHNFKAIKAQFTFAVIFFLAQLRYMGIEQGDCKAGMRVAHFDHLEFRSMSYYWLGGYDWKKFKTFID